MIEETITRIEQRLRQAEHLSERTRAELLMLLDELRNDLGLTGDDTLAAGRVESILRFAEASAHEALRPEQDPELLTLALRGLEQSVQKFETSHPRLTHIVGAISQALASMGV